MLTGEAKKTYQREYMRGYMRKRRLLRPCVKTPVKTYVQPEVLDLLNAGRPIAGDGLTDVAIAFLGQVESKSQVELDEDGNIIPEYD